MKTYDVTAPDGKSYEVTVPDNVTEDDVVRHLASQYKPAKEESTLGSIAQEAGRKVGLTGRMIAQGVTGLPLMVGDAATAAVNYGKRALGMEPSALPSKVVGEAIDYIFPKPQYRGESLQDVVGSAVAGGGLQLGAANAMARALPIARGALRTNPLAATHGGTADDVINMLTANPRAQLASMAAGGVGVSAAREAGLGPWGELAGGLIGGFAPGVPSMAGNMARSKLDPTLAYQAMAKGASGKRLTPEDMESIQKFGRLQNARRLENEGGVMTPGMIVGGGIKRFEDSQSSNPIIGDAINAGKAHTIHTFDRGVINRSLREIGEQLPDHIPVGRQAIDYAHDKISRGYQDLHGRTYGEMDPTFTSDLLNLEQMVMRDLPPGLADEWSRTIGRDILRRFAPNGYFQRVSGESVQRSREELNDLFRKNAYHESGDRRAMGRAYASARLALDDMMERVNPGHAEELGNLNRGYANLVRAEDAAASPGAHQGIFTPAQYRGAVRRGDPTTRHNVFGRGRALGEDLSDAAIDIIPSVVPDSGTPLRTAWRDLLNVMTGDVGAAKRLGLGVGAGLAAGHVYSPAGMRFWQNAILGPRRPVPSVPAITNVLAQMDAENSYGR